MAEPLDAPATAFHATGPAIMEPARPDGARLDAAARDDLRRGWGVERDTRVAWLAADAAGEREVLAAAAATGLASEAGRPWWLVVHPSSPGLRRVRRLLEAMGRPERLIEDARWSEPWRAMAGADAALAVGGPVDLSLGWARLAGLARVAGPAALGRASMASREGLLVADDDRPRSIARLLCRLAEGWDEER